MDETETNFTLGQTTSANESSMEFVLLNEESATAAYYEGTSYYPDLPENVTGKPLPIDMLFNDGHKLAIALYSTLMIISAVGNITVFSVIVRLSRRGKLSRINLFVLNLTIADLIVTFVMMPLEIAWSKTVSWEAGDGMCRAMSFFRIFGLYLSGFTHVCISLDRYIAVIMATARVSDGRKRALIMLAVAWFASIICSLPQSHPEFRWYEQCVTFNSFPSPRFELAYNLVSFFFLYAFPLIMIIFCYTCVLCKMYRSNSKTRNDENLRRSNIGALGRAKSRTLKMSLVIVVTFFFCWTPYNVMSLWYWIDKESAREVDQRIQKGLFIFACTNSCMNPLIYGIFNFTPLKNCWGILNRFQRREVEATN